jgi:hypothetical protein
MGVYTTAGVITSNCRSDNCFGSSCDDFVALGESCSRLEDVFGCDCDGCDCAEDTACPSTCYGNDCNYYASLGWECSSLENEMDCDCTGCNDCGSVQSDIYDLSNIQSANDFNDWTSISDSEGSMEFDIYYDSMSLKKNGASILSLPESFAAYTTYDINVQYIASIYSTSSECSLSASTDRGQTWEVVFSTLTGSATTNALDVANLQKSAGSDATLDGLRLKQFATLSSGESCGITSILVTGA